MVRLTAYEIKKCFWKRPVLFLLAVFTLINLLCVYKTYQDDAVFDEFPQWKELYPMIYGQVGGEMTEEKVNVLLSLYRPLEAQVADHTASTASDNPDTLTGNLYSDYYFLLWNFVQPMEYLYTYRQQAQEIAGAARSNLSLYASAGNGYEYRKNQMIAGMYQDRAVRAFAFTAFYNSFTHYDFSVLLVLLMLLYALPGVFVSEKESGMEYLLLTARQGRGRTVAAKLIAAGLFITGVSLWFWAVDFFGFAAMYGTMDGGSLPVYALENFAQSAVGMPLARYALVSMAVKTLGAVVMGLVFLLFSQFFRSALFPYVLGLLTVFVLAWLYAAYAASSHVFAKICNPFSLLECRMVFRVTEFTSFFGAPVLSCWAALLCGGGWCLLLTFGICAFAGKNTAGKGGGRRWSFLHAN